MRWSLGARKAMERPLHFRSVIRGLLVALVMAAAPSLWVAFAARTSGAPFRPDWFHCLSRRKVSKASLA
jgi:hypothetical protein